MVHLIGCLLLAFRGAHLIIIVLLPPHIGDAHQMLEYDEEMQTDVMWLKREEIVKFICTFFLKSFK